MQEGLKNMSMQERRTPTPKLIKEEVFQLNPMNNPQECEVTMIRVYKNKNGNRDPTTQITGKKARKLNKKRAKLEKLHEVPVKTLQEAGFHNLNLIGIAEQHRLEIHHDEAI
jgi:hypothetical protein